MSNTYNTAEWWQSQIVKAQEFRNKKGRESSWATYKKYYQQELEINQIPNFNLIYMIASSLLPSMVFQQPSVINTPLRPDLISWSSFFDSLDNWIFEELEIIDLAKTAVLQGFLCNVAPFHLGYDFPSE